MKGRSRRLQLSSGSVQDAHVACGAVSLAPRQDNNGETVAEGKIDFHAAYCTLSAIHHRRASAGMTEC